MLGHEETQQLLLQAKNDDEEAKQKLIIENSPLIKSIIKRYINKGIEYDDLFQLGAIGFIKAIKNFDSSFNVKFSTYAVPMIIGEIKRFMRDDGAIKVSRVIKTLNLNINKFIQTYQEKFFNKPSIEEIANEFKIDPQEVIFTMDSAKMPISIYTPLEEDSGKSLLLIDRYAQENGNNELINNIILRDVIRSLDEREKKLIALRFFRDKTQSEIAEILNISQVQVSRLESKILEKLKQKLLG